MNDLFFDYERGQKLGLWVLALDAGLLLGPTCTFVRISQDTDAQYADVQYADIYFQSAAF